MAMDHDAFKEYLESKKYFIDARNWYHTKHLAPVSQRIWVFYTLILLAALFCALILNINLMLPITQKITYPIDVYSDITEGEPNAKILEIPESSLGADAPFRFIATELIRGYVINRENFDYDDLGRQIKYIQTSSTRLVFRKFYNYMSASNPDSPLMRYQKYAKRKIEIQSIKYISNEEVAVTFVSKARAKGGGDFEHLLWSANVHFNMGEVGKKLSAGGRFKFLITDYRLKLQKDLA
jgi:type IV secretion system protein VirB8